MSWEEIIEAFNESTDKQTKLQSKFWNNVPNPRQAVGPTLKKKIGEYFKELFDDENLVNNTILDFGCGVGRIYESIGKPKNYYGIDISEKMIKAFNNKHKRLFLEVINSTKIPFEDNKFDNILCYSVFTHISELQMEEILNEFYRVLKPNGLVGVSIFETEEVKVVPGGFNWVLIYLDDFKDMCEDAGLELIRSIKVPDYYNCSQTLLLLRKTDYNI